MVLPKLSVGFEEEVEDWCSYLNPNMQVELSEHEGMKALKTLVHKRRDHMRSMLKCGKRPSRCITLTCISLQPSLLRKTHIVLSQGIECYAED